MFRSGAFYDLLKWNGETIEKAIDFDALKVHNTLDGSYINWSSYINRDKLIQYMKTGGDVNIETGENYGLIEVDTDGSEKIYEITDVDINGVDSVPGWGFEVKITDESDNELGTYSSDSINGNYAEYNAGEKKIIIHSTIDFPRSLKWDISLKNVEETKLCARIIVLSAYFEQDRLVTDAWYEGSEAETTGQVTANDALSIEKYITKVVDSKGNEMSNLDIGAKALDSFDINGDERIDSSDARIALKLLERNKKTDFSNVTDEEFEELKIKYPFFGNLNMDNDMVRDIKVSDPSYILKMSHSMRQGWKDGGISEQKEAFELNIKYDKKVYPVTIKEDSEVTYIINVYNETHSYNEAVTIKDILPENAELVSVVNATRKPNETGRTLTLTTSPLKGEDISVFVTVKFTQYASEEIHNIAELVNIPENTSEYRQIDGDYVKMNNISLQKYITKVNDNSLGDKRKNALDGGETKTYGKEENNKNLDKLEEPVKIKSGDEVTYTIRVKNIDEKNSTNKIVVWDELPHFSDEKDIYLFDIDNIKFNGIKLEDFPKEGDGYISSINSMQGKYKYKVVLNEIPANGEATFTITVRYTDAINAIDSILTNTARTEDAATDEYRTEDHDYVYRDDLSLQKYITAVNGESLTNSNTDLVDRKNAIANDADELLKRNPSRYLESKEDVKRNNVVKIGAGDKVTYTIGVYNNNSQVAAKDVLVKDTLDLSYRADSIKYTEYEDHEFNVIHNNAKDVDITGAGNLSAIVIPEICKNGSVKIEVTITFNSYVSGIISNKAELPDISEGDTDYRFFDYDYVQMQPKTGISLQKYIEKVDGDTVSPDRSYRLTDKDHTELNRFVNAGQTSFVDKNWYKKDHPVIIKPGQIVRYVVSVYNNGTEPVSGVKVIDNFGENYDLKGIETYIDSINTDYTDFTRDGNKLILNNISIPGKGNKAYSEVKFYIEAKFKGNAIASGLLINTAELELLGNNTTCRTKDADYVQMLLDVSLQKYITKVNGNNLNKSQTQLLNRVDTYASESEKTTTHKGATMKDSYKINNPVEVKQGDKVTYEIVVYNNEEKDIVNATVVDTLPLSKGNINTIKNVKVMLGSEPIYNHKPEDKVISFNTGSFAADELKKVFVVEIEFNDSILGRTETEILENKAELIVAGNDTEYRIVDEDYILLKGAPAEISVEKYISVAADDNKYETERAYRATTNSSDVLVTPEDKKAPDDKRASKQADPVKISSGTTVVYKIKVYNIGSEPDNSGIVITDNLNDTIFSNKGIKNYITNVEYPEGWTYNASTGIIKSPEAPENKIKLGAGEAKEYPVTVTFKEVTSEQKVLGNSVKIEGDNVSSDYRTQDADYVTLTPLNLSLQKYITKVNEADLTIGRTDLQQRADYIWKANTEKNPSKNIEKKTDKAKHENPVRIETGEVVTFVVKVYNNTAQAASRVKVNDKLYLDGSNSAYTQYQLTATNVEIFKDHNCTQKAYTDSVQYGTSWLSSGSLALEQAIPGNGCAVITMKVKFTETISSEKLIVNEASINGGSDSDTYRWKDYDIVKMRPTTNPDVSLQKYIVSTSTVPTTSGQVYVNSDQASITNRKNYYAVARNDDKEGKTFSFGYNTPNVTGQHGWYNGEPTATTRTVTLNTHISERLATNERDKYVRDNPGRNISWELKKTGLEWSNPEEVSEREYNLALGVTKRKYDITYTTTTTTEPKYETHYYYRTRKNIFSKWGEWTECSKTEYDKMLKTTRRQKKTEDVFAGYKTVTTSTPHYWIQELRAGYYYVGTYTQTTENTIDRDISTRNHVNQSGYKVTDVVNVSDGNDVTFTIRVYNNSNTDKAYDVVVKDIYSKGATIGGIKAGIGSASNENAINLTDISSLSSIGYNERENQFIIYELPTNSVAIINVTMKLSTPDPNDLVKVNAAYIQSIKGTNTTKYRTADADYVQIEMANLSLQKYIVATDGEKALTSSKTSMTNRKNRYAIDPAATVNRDEDDVLSSHGSHIRIAKTTDVNISKSNSVQAGYTAGVVNKGDRKYQNPVQIADGEDVTFTIRLYNNAKNATHNIKIKDELQSGVNGEITQIKYYVANESSDNTPKESTVTLAKANDGSLAGGTLTYKNGVYTVADIGGSEAIVINVTMKMNLTDDYKEFAGNPLSMSLQNTYRNMAYIDTVGDLSYKNINNGNRRKVDADYIKFIPDDVSMQKYITGVSVDGIDQPVRGAHVIGTKTTTYRSYLNAKAAAESNVWPSVMTNDIGNPRHNARGVSNNAKGMELGTNSGALLRSSVDQKVELISEGWDNADSTAYTLQTGDELLTYTIMVYNNNDAATFDKIISDYNDVKMKVESVYAREISMGEEQGYVTPKNSQLIAQYETDESKEVTSKLVNVKLNENGGISTFSIPRISANSIIVINITTRLDVPQDWSAKKAIGNYAWLRNSKTNYSKFRSGDADWVSIDTESYASIEKYIVNQNPPRENSKTSITADGDNLPVTPYNKVKDYNKDGTNAVTVVNGDEVTYAIKVRTFGIKRPSNLVVTDNFNGNGKITKIACEATTTFEAPTKRIIWNETDKWVQSYKIIDTNESMWKIYDINKDASHIDSKGFTIKFNTITSYSGVFAGLTSAEGTRNQSSYAILYVTVKYDGLTEGSTYVNKVTLTTPSGEETNPNKLRHKDADYIKVAPPTYQVSLQKYIVQVNDSNIAENRSAWKARGAANNSEGDNKNVTATLSTKTNVKYDNVKTIYEGDTVTYKIEVYNNHSDSRAVPVKVTDTFDNGEITSVKVANSASANIGDATTASYTETADGIEIDLGNMAKDTTKAIFVTLKYDELDTTQKFKNTASLNVSGNKKTYRVVDSDYVIMGEIPPEPESDISLQKYITKVTTKDGTENYNRSGWKASESLLEGDNRPVTAKIPVVDKYKSANENLIKVNAGDTVTYGIFVYNNGEKTEDVVIADNLPYYGDKNSWNSAVTAGAITKEYYYEKEEYTDPYLVKYVSWQDGWTFAGQEGNGTKKTQEVKIYNANGSVNRTDSAYWDVNTYYHTISNLKPGEKVYIELTVKVNEVLSEDSKVLKNTASILRTSLDDNKTDYRTIDSDYILVEPSGKLNVSLQKYIIKLNNSNVASRSKWATYTSDNRDGVNKDVTASMLTINNYKKEQAVEIEQNNEVTYRIEVHNNLNMEVNTPITVTDVLPYHIVADGTDTTKEVEELVAQIWDNGTWKNLSETKFVIDRIEPNGVVNIDVRLKFNKNVSGLFENNAYISDTGDMENQTEYRTNDSDWVRMGEKTDNVDVSMQKYISYAAGEEYGRQRNGWIAWTNSDLDKKYAEDVTDSSGEIVKRNGNSVYSDDFYGVVNKNDEIDKAPASGVSKVNTSKLQFTDDRNDENDSALTVGNNSTVTYRIHLYNNGDRTANEVTIEDQLPYYSYYEVDENTHRRKESATELKYKSAVEVTKVQVFDDITGKLKLDNISTATTPRLDGKGDIYVYSYPNLLPGEGVYLEITVKYVIDEYEWETVHTSSREAGEGSILPNKAKIIGTSEENNTEYRLIDYDFVRVEVDNSVDISLEKYIVKTSDKNGNSENYDYDDTTERSGWLSWNAPEDTNYYDEFTKDVANKDIFGVKGYSEFNTTKADEKISIDIGDLVTYRIYLYNNGGKEAEWVDVWERLPWYEKDGQIKSAASVKEVKLYEESKENGSLTDKTDSLVIPDASTLSSDGYEGYVYRVQNLPAETKYFLEITLEFNRFNISDLNTRTLNNGAAINDTSKENITEYRTRDYDFVYLREYSVKLEKFIGAINDKILSENPDAAGMIGYRGGHPMYERPNSLEKDKQVVTVEKGQKVEYTIIVTNTGGNNIDAYGDVYVDVKDTLTDRTKFNVSEVGWNSGEKFWENKKIPIDAINIETHQLQVVINEENISLDVLKNEAEITEIRNRNGLIVTDADGYENNKDSDYLQMKDIVIEGTVWNDVAVNKNNDSYNGKLDGYEKTIDGIKVDLYRVGESKPIATRITSNGGKYTFSLDYIKASMQSGTNRWDQYYSYYVVFEYDGITYTSTYVNDLNNMGARGTYIWDYASNNYLDYSKAAEDNENGLVGLQQRQAFNSKYYTIDGDSNIGYETKNREGYIPESKYTNADTIKASSNLITFEESQDRENQIKHINLGLRGREILDLELTSDVRRIEVTVNNVKGVYKYTNTATLKRNDISQKATVNSTNIEEDMANQIPETSEGNYVDTVNHDLRSTDTTVSKANSTYSKTGIKVRVIYAITINNAAITNARATKIKDYYDGHYYYEGTCDVNGNIIEANSDPMPTSYDGTLYREKTIDITESGSGIEQGKDEVIYLAFSLIDAEKELSKADKDADKDIFPTFNMAEITKYKNYANDTKYSEYTRGLIDKDSAPDGVNKEQVRTTDNDIEDNRIMPELPTTGGNPTTLGYYFEHKNHDVKEDPNCLMKLKYEDDTCASPTIYFIINDIFRTLTGTVFEDNDINISDKIAVGNGKMDAEENKVKGATVQLIELIKDDDGKVVDQVIRYQTTSGTDEAKAGEYTFTHFLSGDYIIRYYYGDTVRTVLIGDGIKEYTYNGDIYTPSNSESSYNGEDYQSTRNEFDDGISKRADYWYLGSKGENKNYDRPDEYSVATDDVTRRITVSNNVGGHYQDDKNDNETAGNWIPGFDDSTMQTLNNIRDKEKSLSIAENKVKDIIDGTYMFADTQSMRINVEKMDDPETGDSKDTYSYINRDYSIKNMNFGITKAPTTDVKFAKHIVEFKIVDSAGTNVIAEGTYNESTKQWTISDSSTGNTLTIPALDENLTKLINIQIEDDKLQGAKLNVKYRISAQIDQEKDFDNSIVTIQNIAELYDYIDNDLSFNPALNPNWTIDTAKTAINVEHSGLTNNEADGTLGTKEYKYNTVVKASGSNALLGDLSSGNVLSEDIVLEKVLSSNNTSLARILTDIGDTYEYNNLVEVTKLNYIHSGGTDNRYGEHIFRDAIRRTDTNPDPYTFDADTYEYVMVGNWQHDTAISGTIAINPPTGTNEIPMAYYIVAVIALGGVATGAIIAKRKISKK